MTFIPAPHVLPYQGSKRKLATDILSFFPNDIGCLYEPFAGSAAITLAAAANELAGRFVIGDKLEPLAELWKQVIDQPELLAEEYASLWHGQLSDPAAFFLETRKKFNVTGDAAKLLYLVARCVKNSIRFNGACHFNQGADKRRLGLRPEKLAREVIKTSTILQGRTKVIAGDFREIIKDAGPDDLVYMDPPWQGTSGKKDPRYAFLLNLDELIDELALLNSRRVPYILSFDGTCGDRGYGEALPESLKLRKINLNAGRSSQATLLGRDEVTIESLYLSNALVSKLEGVPSPSAVEVRHQINLFDTIDC